MLLKPAMMQNGATGGVPALRAAAAATLARRAATAAEAPPAPAALPGAFWIISVAWG